MPEYRTPFPGIMAALLEAGINRVLAMDENTPQRLGRLADLLALSGDAATVYAAERAMKSTSFKRRRQAVDLLQETVSGSRRVRLIELLEKYLNPAKAATPGARQRICDQDPWLAKCLAASGDDYRKLWALRSASLFDSAPGTAIEQLVPHCVLQDHSKGSEIVCEEQPGDDLFVLIEGSASVERKGEVIAELRVGSAFGELALVDGQPRQATVRALAPCRVLRLASAPFQQALASHPDLGLGLVRSLTQMLRVELDRSP